MYRNKVSTAGVKFYEIDNAVNLLNRIKKKVKLA